MNRLLWVILAAMVLGAVASGCGHEPRYDSRLTAADSLLRDDPDSALAMLEALASDSSVARSDGAGGIDFSDADIAYHALLLTQARYKCYVTATSDSDINLALAYFRAHPADREKLTRAFIYKGAVMDELGHPDSAMLYYKHAEATAAPDDYFNLGYVKMRIATLYQDQISQDSAAIIRLKQAIQYFKLINDTNYLISCYGDLGAICGVRYPDSTEYYLTQAIELAKDYNLAKHYTYKSKLAGFYYYHHKDYLRANQLAMDIVKNGRSFCREEQYYYYSALTYLELGKIDSATYIMSITPTPDNAGDSMMYLDVMVEMAKKEQNLKNLSESSISSKELTTQYVTNLNEAQLVAAENKFDKLQAENQSAIQGEHNKVLERILSIAALILLALAVVNYRMRASIKKFNEEKRSIKNEFNRHLAELEAQQECTERINKSVSDQLADRIAVIRELYQSIRVKISDDTKVKRIVPLSSILKSMNEKNELLNMELSNSFWTRLQKSVDDEYDGIATFVQQSFPEMQPKYMRLFCLLCARVSPQIIMLCLNMKSASNVSNYKNRLIKEQIGLDMNFKEFIQLYQSGKIQGIISGQNSKVK